MKALGGFLLFLLATAAVSAEEWQLVFEDDFGPANQTAPTPPNASKWDPQLGYSNGSLEKSYWTNRTKNLYQSMGTLKIATLMEQYVVNPDSGETASYTGAAVKTATPFKYGRFEGSIKLPPGVGTHPGFWMLANYTGNPTPWPLCGEIDIMENVGFVPGMMYSTLHDGANNWERGNDISNMRNISTMYTDFVNYTAVWTPDTIEIYGNGIQVLKRNNPQTCQLQTWPWFSFFNLWIQMDIGGRWGGQHGIDNSIFPAIMEIDYVRIYQKKDYGTPSVGTSMLDCGNTPYYVTIQGHNLTNPNLFYNNLVLNGTHQTSLQAAVKTDLELILKSALPAPIQISFSGTNKPTQPVLKIESLVPLPSTGELLLNFTMVNTPYSSASGKSVLGLLSNLVDKKSAQDSFPTLYYYLQAVNKGLTIEKVTYTSSVGSTNPPPVLDSFGGGMPYTITTVPPALSPSESAGVSSPWIAFSQYDFGGQLVGSYDTTSWNVFGDYGRAGLDYVDLKPASRYALSQVAVPEATATSELIVGEIESGEWLHFSGLNISDLPWEAMMEQDFDLENVTMTYSIQFAYSNKHVVQEGQMKLEIDGAELENGAPLNFPGTDGAITTSLTAPQDITFFRNRSLTIDSTTNSSMHSIRFKFLTSQRYELLGFKLNPAGPAGQNQNNNNSGTTSHLAIILVGAIVGGIVFLLIVAVIINTYRNRRRVDPLSDDIQTQAGRKSDALIYGTGV